MSSGLYRRRLFHAVFVMGALTGPAAMAMAKEAGGEARNYDARDAYNAQARFGFSLTQQSSVAALRRSIPELLVEVDASRGLVRSLTNPVGALSGPNGGDALAIGLDFVQKHREALGLEPRDLTHLEVADRVYSKVVSNVEEVRARGGKIIAVVSEDDRELINMVDHAIPIPHTHDLLTPILAAVPLQLLAYYIAVKRGSNVDQPRNLAKSVTVE